MPVDSSYFRFISLCYEANKLIMINRRAKLHSFNSTVFLKSIFSNYTQLVILAFMGLKDGFGARNDYTSEHVPHSAIIEKDAIIASFSLSQQLVSLK